MLTRELELHVPSCHNQIEIRDALRLHERGRSITGNVFNRLGRGTNIRETFNKRQEQEGSQHSIKQKVQTEANSQGLRNILLDDLQCAIASIEEEDDELVAEAGGSPFYKEIWEAPLLEGFKLLNIKAYERKADPQDHLDHFNELMVLHMYQTRPNVGCSLSL